MIDAVARAGLLAPGRPVVVLLSGGRDSVCLLDLAVRIAGAPATRAVHVNYGLRDGADGDEEHCALLCERLGIPLKVRRVERTENGNLQAWARRERYAVAAEIAQGADVAAGHTASDQVETILYRLASSPSRRALLGMRPREALPGRKQRGQLIRPLLQFTRAHTRAYCLDRGLTWREDESNEATTFARARIRTTLVPALRSVHPAAEENVLALSELLRDEAEVLDHVVDEVLAGGSEVHLTQLRALPPALRRLIVQRLADGAAGGPAPGAARRADEVAALSEHGVAALDLPHGVRAVAEDGVLRFALTPPKPNHGARSAPPIR